MASEERAKGRKWCEDMIEHWGSWIAAGVAEQYRDEYLDGEVPSEFGQGFIEAFEEWFAEYGDDAKGSDSDE